MPYRTAALRPEWYRAALRATLSSIGDAVITTDNQGRVTFLNPAAESLTGWTLDEATGQPLDRAFSVINEESRDPVESSAVRALRDGVVVPLAQQRLLVARDGTERPIGDGATPIPILDDAGEVHGAVLVFRDESDRRHAEQQVQEALAYADDIIATLREPFVVLDAQLRVRTANSSFYRSFAVSKAETEGSFIYDLGNGQWDIPRLRTLLEEVLPRDVAFSDFEVDHTFPVVGHKVMLLNARRVSSMKIAPEMILLAIEDITQQHKADAAVEASEVRYRRLFETARDGILILDAASGVIIDANPFMTELLGYSHDEFLGRQLWQISPPAERARHEAAVCELRERRSVRYEHLPLATRTGEAVDVEFVSNIYRVEERDVAQCNIRDIRDRVRLERKMQEQAAELAELSQRKDEFLAVLNHELRNPIAPIANAVQLLALQHATETPVQMRARTVIARQVDLLKHLVDDLLDVSRITTGRVRLRLARVAVSAIVDGALETALPMVEQRKHAVEVSLPAEPIWLDADAARLEQVIVNLLTNAAKYMDPGGHIRLTVAREGDDCVVRVRDTGIGIAPEMLPRIFELFTQAERWPDRSDGGLGIGLSLVRGFIEMHGGTVDATSVVGEGSEFTVRLPAAPATESAVVTAPPAPCASGVRNLRVLVVDDDVAVAGNLARLVQAEGHHVRTAYDGASALSIAAEYRPDAVLLDVGLPGLRGHAVARHLREQSPASKMMLVALTAYAQDPGEGHSTAEDFDHQLVKPPDFVKLRGILAAIESVTGD